MVMEAKVVFYSQKGIEPRQRTKFKKELSGHNDSSHGGRYKYRIEGVLDKVGHIKPANASLIVKIKDYRSIVSLMKRYSIKYKVYSIEVPESHFVK